MRSSAKQSRSGEWVKEREEQRFLEMSGPVMLKEERSDAPPLSRGPGRVPWQAALTVVTVVDADFASPHEERQLRSGRVGKRGRSEA